MGATPSDSVAGTRVRFVVVPFAPVRLPALGVSSLLAVLREAGMDGDVRYLNLAYGERLGWDLYRYVGEKLSPSFLAGDMLFGRALWRDRAPEFAQYEQRIVEWFEQVCADDGSGLRAVPAEWAREAASVMLVEWTRNAEAMRAAIEEAPRVVAAWADEVLAGTPRVLGFTSTFQQSGAALALAQEVRRRVPAEEVAIVFGGANCEDDMGRAMADNFAFIDCVVAGEGEKVIVDVIRQILDGGAPLPRFVRGPMVSDLDALPVPDLHDYFAAAARTSIGERTWLVAESSRGCWWGAKSQCAFCGLNGRMVTFRSKSAGRFATELETLSRRHGEHGFALTDNILDMRYLRTLLPDLVAGARRYQLFYETKSNLRKEQVELLAAAGVSSLQPGIESFSTPILKLMGKGTTRLQNVQLLKWCAELGVAVNWNVLWGFPGEDPREYDEMADLLPALFHLPPPMGSSPFRLDRFAPYWRSPERHGICNVRPAWPYDFTFAGLPERERARLAYFFDYEYVDRREPAVYARSVASRVAEWRELARAKRPRLVLRGAAGEHAVVDTRPCRRDEVFSLTPSGLALVRALDRLRSAASLREAMREEGVDISEDECDGLLAEFLVRRFVIAENGCWLSLIVDPQERRRVAERQVALRANRYGLRWPQDFPDPEKRQVVRAAMLALGTEPSTS